MNDQKIIRILFVGVFLAMALLLGFYHYNNYQMKGEIQKDFYFETPVNGCTLYTDKNIKLTSGADLLKDASNSVYEHKFTLREEMPSFVYVENYHDVQLIEYNQGRIEFNGGDYSHRFYCVGDSDD